MNFRASLATYVFLGLVSNFTILLPHLKKKKRRRGEWENRAYSGVVKTWERRKGSLDAKCCIHTGLFVSIQSPYVFKTGRGCFPSAQQARFHKDALAITQSLFSSRHLQIDLFPCFQVEKVSSWVMIQGWGLGVHGGLCICRKRNRVRRRRPGVSGEQRGYVFGVYRRQTPETEGMGHRLDWTLDLNWNRQGPNF